MRKRMVWVGCQILLVILAVPAWAQRSPERSRGPVRQRGASRRQPSVRQPRASATTDPDYRAFHREVPQDRFEAAVAESAGPEARHPQGFSFLDLDYPTGQDNPTSYRFDMGPAGAPVAPGWTGIV